MSTYQSINPHAPDDIVANVPFTDPSEVATVVAAARAASAAWSRTPAPERGRLIGEIGDRIAAAADELARMVAREVGKPVVEARGEIARAVAIHRYYAQVALLPNGESYPAGAPKAWILTRRYPVGTCGLITPWNFPIAIPVWKAVPALVFGNAVVLKPAPEASEVARLYHAVAESVLPAGVFQLVLGDGEAGSGLVDHPGVDAVSFTGSVDVGRTVAQSVAARGGHFQGELSGHNPSVVLADADLGTAARIIIGAAMGYAGQKCTATGRIIVETSVYEEFREHLLANVGALTLMDPMSEACQVGPVIDDAARTRALAAVDELGGEVLTGARAPEGAAGFYLEPTLVELDDPARAAEREIFAPVALITRAESAGAALEQANAGRYGLVASVFTSRIANAIRFCDELKVGLVRVNAPTAGVDFHVPFGGAKESGIGPREQGLAARDFYTESRSILVAS
jgi:acyl-CoA reductase-like NAD-dependent aldehyde dehydrogenase